LPATGELPLDAEVKEKSTEKLRSDPREFCGQGVSEVVRTDRLKLFSTTVRGVCYRLSGTEPVVLVYSEARSEQGLEKLGAAAKQWIFE
jgi:phosphoglucomutase